MRSATILALTIVSFGLLPVACTQDFGFFASSQGTGGTGTTTTSSSSGTMASSSSTSSSSTSSSSGGTVCKMDSDCDDANDCTTDTCNTATGVCSNVAVPDGTPPGYVDAVKDCKTQKCIGGVQTSVAADTDVPPSGNPCVTNTCGNMMVLMSDVGAGTPCGGNNQVCDGAGNCVGCTMTSQCANPGACKSVTCDVPTHKCVVSNNASGTACTGGGGAMVCNNNGTCVQCVVGSDCASGNCNGNNTCGLANNGHACTQGNQCLMGHCVNGVCCDATCNGTCMACTNALTNQADGHCATIKAGTPPVPASQCAAASCGNTGNCAAGGTCEQAATGSNCGTGPTCVGNSFHAQQTCGAGMTCGGSSMDCLTYKCAASGCPVSCTTDSQCVAGNYCLIPAATGTCVPQIADGIACTASDQCLNGFCNPTSMKCATPTCSDTFQNGNETDVDCGGTCPKCMTGQKCLVNGDCTTFCKNNKTCQ